jgi:L-alanine-DL-glutamate epimerase-like enolase superfamily enzyme
MWSASGRDRAADALEAVRRVRDAVGTEVTLVALYPEVSGHLLRNTPTRHWLEWQDWAHPVLDHPFEIRDGLLHLPDVPGNGLQWDEEAVAHYATDL